MPGQYGFGLQHREPPVTDENTDNGDHSDNDTSACAPEVVGVFPDQASFDAAVTALKQAGFGHADLSVLASHEALEAAEPPGRTWSDVLHSLVGEVRYENPLVASGAIFLAGGPITAAVAAVIGAAVGALAVRDVVEDVVARPHAEQFARSVEAGGIILWVCAETPEREAIARRIMEAHSGLNVHVVHRRPAG